MSVSLKRNEEIVKKSINDPIFFIKTFCKIQHPIRGVIPFKLHPYQEQLILTTVEHPYVIVNKSRQLGVSTVSAAFCLWYTMFHHTKNILVIATKRDVAKNFVDKCRFMYDNLPPAFRQFAPLSANNKQEIIFDHTSSKIKAIGTSEDAGRSEAVSWLFVDEAAFVNGMDDIWTSLWPIISTGGRCMLLSTPNGTGNIFYEIYAKAKAQENSFVAVDLPWYSDPSRDEEWYKKQISAFGQKRFDQEYGLSFQSQDNAFLPEDVFDFVKSTIKNPVENWRHSGKLWVWEKPIPHEEYAIGADVSSGHSDDYSTLQVIRAKTNEQVAEFHAKVDTSDFAQILCDIGSEYNTAVLCIERNNLGDSVLKRIRDYVTYQKLMFTDSFGNPIVTNSYDGFNTSGIKAGFNMQTKTRLNVLNTVLEGLASQQYRIRSERLLNEFRTFIIRAGKAEHTKSKNDDLIIAYALSVWTREYCLKQLSAGLEYQESFLKSISRDFVSTNQLNPETTGFNFYGTPDKIKSYSQESLGIYSPFGPMESSNYNGFLEPGRPKYNKKLGRVASRRVTDPFGE